MTQKPAYEELERRIQELEKESDKRKQVEEALRKSDDCYRALFNYNPIETVIVDREARVTGYNLAKKRSGGRLPDINNDVLYKDYAGKHKINMFEELMECIRSGISKEFPEQKYRDKFLDIMIAPFSEGAIITSINVTDRMQSEEKLRKSEERLSQIVEGTSVPVFVIDKEHVITHWNRACENITGISANEVIGTRKQWSAFYSKERPVMADLIVDESAEEEISRYYEGKYQKSVLTEGAYEAEDFFPDIAESGRWLFFTAAPLRDFQGKVAGAIETLQDTTDRNRAEEQIKKSLKEKNILLQEIHHRVKNNMQVISSLLNLQSQYVKDKESLEMFKESRDRIRSMAFVHEKLYQSKDLTKINFDGYIRSMTQHLLRINSIDPGAVRLNINCSDVFLDINKAVPCGLIINELISNAFKHAFPEGEKGEITIDFHPDKDNRLTLAVSDTGTGFPEDIGISDAKTLGLQLISALTDQLKGTLEIERDGGTAFKITFKA